MKKHAIIFMLLVALIGYIMVSTAARNNAIDEYKLVQWRYEHALNH